MGGFGALVGRLEELIISLIFAAMTLVTFSQVIARYVYNSGAVWALELTTTLFAWLVLFGISYGIKRSAHLGVDAFANLFSRSIQRIFGLTVIGVFMAFALFVLWGSYEYVGKMYKIGIYSVDLPVKRWVLLSILPISMILIIIRLIEVGLKVWRDEQTSILADEAHSAIEDQSVEEQRA